jgi:hypothetical protein
MGSQRKDHIPNNKLMEGFSDQGPDGRPIDPGDMLAALMREHPERMGKVPKFEDRYPEGKLDPSDEGVLDIRMGLTPAGTFIVDFGKPVVWFGMTREQGVVLAKRILRTCADSVVTVEIPDKP